MSIAVKGEEEPQRKFCRREMEIIQRSHVRYPYKFKTDGSVY